MHILATEGLTKRFPTVTALDRLTVTVGPGVTGLVGANGAGKSTLIKILLGLLPATEGRATVLGHDAFTQGAQIRRLVGYMPEAQRVALTQRALVLLIVAQLAYLLGYYGTEGRALSALFPRVSQRSWHGGRLLVCVLITAAAFAVVYALFQARVGGGLFDLSQMSRGKEVLRDHRLSWMARGIQFGLVPVLLLAAAAMADRSRRLLAVTAAAFLIVALLVNRMGHRGSVVLAAMMIVAMFHFLWRRLSFTFVGALVLVAVVAVNILGEYRRGQAPETTMVEGMSQPLHSAATHEQDRRRLDVLGLILHVFPERHPYLMGESYYGLVAALVPRWVWPDKANHFTWRDTNIVPKLTGFPAPTPYPAALYANFSWVGVLLGMALFGAFHKGLYRYRESAPGEIGTVLVYIAVLGCFSPTLIGVSFTLQFVVPIVGLVYVISRPRLAPVAGAGAAVAVGARAAPSAGRGLGAALRELPASGAGSETG